MLNKLANITSIKADALAGTTVAAGAAIWTDMFVGYLEIGVLVLGVITGLFSLYWNVNKVLEKRRLRNGKSG